jgi:hypothetical protein
MAVMLERTERFSADAGLRINRGKTKRMVIDRPNNNRLELTEIHGIQVSFVYLESLISINKGWSEVEAKRSSRG